MTAASPHAQQRIETLDIVSLGVSVENLVQKQIWNQLQNGAAESILSTDPDDYPSEWKLRQLHAKQRSVAVMRFALCNFVQGWRVPAVSVWPRWNGQGARESLKIDRAELDYFNHRIDDLRILAGLHQHQIHSLGSHFADEPEQLIDRIFSFFDMHAELPALLVFACDGDVTRELTRDARRGAQWGDGQRRFDSMAESAVALIFARRDRVDAFLRPYAGTRAGRFNDAGPTQVGYKPSTFVAECWSSEQIDRFDRLRTLAVLHRPIRTSYCKDKNGAPTFERDEHTRPINSRLREEKFQHALQSALQDVAGCTPTRVFFDAGPESGLRTAPLVQGVSQCLPEIDLYRADQWVDLNRRVGNTGACSPFVQLAMSAIAAFETGDSSLAACLRQSDEATIAIVSPACPKPTVEPVYRPDDATDISHQAASGAPQLAAVTQRLSEIGTLLSSGDQCTQSGTWCCDPPDEIAGNTHYFPVGRTLPRVRSRREISKWKKFRGKRELQYVAAKWTLVSYDVPTVP